MEKLLIVKINGIIMMITFYVKQFLNTDLETGKISWKMMRYGTNPILLYSKKILIQMIIIKVIKLF